MDVEDIQAHIEAFEDYSDNYHELLRLPNGEDSHAVHRQEIERGHRWQAHYERMLKKALRAP